PHNIANEREQRPDDDQNNASRYCEGVKFAEKERNHQRCLNRADPAAGFFDSDKASADLDDIAMLKSGDTGQLQKCYVDGGYNSHQILDDDLFDPDRPRHGDQKKQNRKSKMAQPSAAAAE